MQLQIKNDFDVVLGGASKRRDQATPIGQEILGLLDVVWAKIRGSGIKQNGINIVVYEPDGILFAGVEILETDATRGGLTSKRVKLPKYAYFKHIGPYSHIHQACAQMGEELTRMGHTPVLPIVEIYGHWTEDEAALETEILHAIAE